jgi:hypothetical protein
MNIVKTEQPFLIEAKTTSDYFRNKKSISYHFIDSSDSLCLNKIEIISAQIQACERLLKYAKDQIEKEIIEREVLELRFALDHKFLK